MTKNKVKFGLKNVHYALLTVSEEGAVSFGAPVPIPGAVSMSLSPQGETETFYADDIAYYVSTANNGYQGDLEIALLPDSFRTDVLREVEDETDHVLVEKSTAEPQPFALLYQFTGDQQASLRVLYNCPGPVRPAPPSKILRPPPRIPCPSLPLPWPTETLKPRPQRILRMRSKRTGLSRSGSLVLPPLCDRGHTWRPVF